MALLQLPRWGISSPLSSASHVGVGGEHLRAPWLCQLRTSRLRGVPEKGSPLAVVAVGLFPVEEDEETRWGGRPGRGGGGGGGRDSSWEDRGSSNPSSSRGRGVRIGRGRDSRSSDNAFSSRNGYGGGDWDNSRSGSGRGEFGSRDGGSFAGRGSSFGGDRGRGRGRGSFGGDNTPRRFSGNGPPARGGYAERGYRDDRQSSSRSGFQKSRGGSFSGSERFSGGRDGGNSGTRYVDKESPFSRRVGNGETLTRPDFRRGEGDGGRRTGNTRNGDRSSRPDFRRGDGNDGGRYGNMRNDRESYGQREGSRGVERTRSNEGGRKSSKKVNAKAYSQTIIPRKSSSDFVSDRIVHRPPWEQGRSSRSLPEQDYANTNPLIERLQKMQAEAAAEVDYDSEEDDDFNIDVDDATEYDDDDDDDDEEEDEKGGPQAVDFDDDAYFENGGQSAMARIVEKLSNLQGSKSVYQTKGSEAGSDSVFVPQYGSPILPSVGPGWSTPDHPVPTPAAAVQKSRPDTRFPWEREEEKALEERPVKLVRVKPPTLAELTLPEEDLRRLRSLGILARHRVKVGKLGVTNGIVQSMHNEWKTSEVVRVKCEGPPAQNMKRTHEQLEEKSGGLVVWRAGGACLVYRGKDYVAPEMKGVLDMQDVAAASGEGGAEAAGEEGEVTDPYNPVVVSARKIAVPRVNSIYDPELEMEMEEILSELGPRYDDWTGVAPVPVDADLLVGASDAEFKKPYRLLPYGLRSGLSNLELTNLRRLARPIPPHFVLGRNRNLGGLADAIIKLWARSEIVKIAVKRGVQNTNHERMAELLKRLTGGILLARDKFFITMYRGKDFLPPAVADALEERQNRAEDLQEEEERLRFQRVKKRAEEISVEKAIAGTLAETLEAKANWEVLHGSDLEQRSREEAMLSARRDLTRRIQKKVTTTMYKKARAEFLLAKVEKRLRPAGPPVDRENITDEERHMFSKLGLKMHAFLLLGRRGIFDGTVENMHLHWKHRELVKVIYKARDKIDLEQTARMLEYESGGILVATIATNKGQAIIVYRGKNYSRPPQLRPETLLTKRQALKRSIEMQRQQALTKHLQSLEREIERMQVELNRARQEEGIDTTSDASEDSPDSPFSGLKGHLEDQEWAGDSSDDEDRDAEDYFEDSDWDEEEEGKVVEDHFQESDWDDEEDETVIENEFDGTEEEENSVEDEFDQDEFDEDAIIRAEFLARAKADQEDLDESDWDEEEENSTENGADDDNFLLMEKRQTVPSSEGDDHTRLA